MKPNIALVGNPPTDVCEQLNERLAEEGLADLCDVALYGADGQPDADALKDALLDYKDGKVQAIVCLPLRAGIRDVLRETLGDEECNAMLTLFVGHDAILTSVNGDMDADAALPLLTKESITAFCQNVERALKRDFLVLRPRLLITSIEESFDNEEDSVEYRAIAPAINELAEGGVLAFGPCRDAEVLSDDNVRAYDAVVEMYEGQCMSALCERENSQPMVVYANITPVVVAVRDYQSVLNAIFTAKDIIRNRKEYDAPFANPLPKLYHEHREDGDKARFAIKRKGGFNPSEHRRENVSYTSLPSSGQGETKSSLPSDDVKGETKDK